MHIPLLRRAHSYAQLNNYILLEAQARSALKYHVPWVVICVAVKLNKPLPQLQIGSQIIMVDSERSKIIGQEIRHKGVLTSVVMVEQGYVVYILKAHGKGKPDIYGSHHSSSRVAIPRHLLCLNHIAALYYHFNFKNLSQSIGQIRLSTPLADHLWEPCPPDRLENRRGMQSRLEWERVKGNIGRWKNEKMNF
jgi:hypothetical protein